MFKKIMGVMGATALSLSLLITPILSHVQAESKSVSFDEKLQVFHDEYDKSQDFDKALDKLTKKHPEIIIKSHEKKNIVAYQDGTYGEESNGEVSTNSVSLGNLTWNDAILYDNDSQKYNYTGGWKWSTMFASEPYDMIGVFPNDTTKMTLSPGTNLTLRGYNAYGTQKAFWSTSGSTSGQVQLATTLNSNGVAFWINEKDVRNGTISVHLNKVTHDPNARIQLQYNHSYTSTTITGVGGSVSVKDAGGGFNIEWENNVIGQGPFYSPGAYTGDTTY